MSDDRTSYEAEVAVDARVKKKDFYLKGFVSPSIHFCCLFGSRL